MDVVVLSRAPTNQRSPPEDAQGGGELAEIGLVSGKLAIGEDPPGQRPPHRGLRGRDPRTRCQ